MTYRVKKVREGAYNLEHKEGKRYELVGTIYRMPYVNMSRSWRVIPPEQYRAEMDRPIAGSKKEALETLKRIFETGKL